MRLSIFFQRTLIVCAWVLLLFGALYFPNLKIFPFEEKTINIFAWGDILNPEILAEFEKESGIKVHLSFYATNEELQVKMQATGGNGYDLIMPSNYTISMMIQEGLLKPLNHSKLHFFNDLNPVLLNHSFDSGNRYSVPFEWEVFGLGVDRNYFVNRPFYPSWRALFDESVIDYKIAFDNDPIDAVLFASLYLFGKTDRITEPEFQEIRSLLIRQRKWVEAYSDFRADYFIATGNCPVAISSSSKFKRIREKFPQIDFVIPEEGTFITIENFCIPKTSQKEEYVYRFLNFLYSRDSLARHFHEFGFFPATLSVLRDLELDGYEKELVYIEQKDFKKFHFFKNILPQQKVRDLWVEVKSF